MKLKNIKLHFSPPNTNLIFQSMDQRLTKNFKTLYRKELIFMIFRFIDKGLLNPSSVAMDISLKFRFLVPLIGWRKIEEVYVKQHSKTVSNAGFQAVHTEVKDELQDSNF